MPNPVSGEIDSQDLNDWFSYLTNLALQANGGPVDEVKTVSELNSKYPNGANGVVLVDGVIYLWNGTKWFTNGTIYKAEALADESVTTEKIAPAATNYTRTDFLENDSTENLFDGVYLNNLSINGPSADGSYSLVERSNSKLIMREIKPNTTYSIRREVPSRLNYATSTKKLSAGETFDGSIGRNQSGSGESSTPVEFKITTGANDKILSMSMSVDGKEPFVRIVEGELPLEENYRYSVKPNEQKVDILPRSKYEKDVYDVEKVKFLERVNLFNGNFIEGAIIGGGAPFLFNLSENGKTAEIPIKPNTNYSWGREVPSRMNWGTATRKLTPGVGDYLDGSLKFNSSGVGTSTSPEIYNFTTGPNDQYLYINNSNDGIEKFLIVVEGELDEIGEYDYRRAKPAEYLDVTTKEQVIDLIGKLSPSSELRKMRAIFDGTSSLNIYVPSRKTNRWIKYNYTKIDDNTINMHQWRVLKTLIVNDNDSVIYDLDNHTEWEGAIKEVGRQDYMGGWHGDENNIDVSFMFDGVENDMSAAFDVTVDREIRIINHSMLNRADLPGHNLLKRTKVSIWTKDKYTVENVYTCLEAFEIEESKITLMSCRYQDASSGATIIKYGRRDDTYTKMAMSAASIGDLSTKTKDCHFMEFWGDDFYMSAECVADYEKYPNRFQNVANFSGLNRAKMYFDVTGNYQISAGEELRNKSIYRIIV